MMISSLIAALNRLRIWALRRHGLTTGEFDQLEQIVERREGILPGNLISAPDAARLEKRGLVTRGELTQGGHPWRATLDGYLAWDRVKSTPRRDGNWLKLW